MYAIDLLAFGASAKPILEYTVELWQDLVVDFLAEFVDRPAVLVGNSLGSLIALAVSQAYVPVPRRHAEVAARDSVTTARKRYVTISNLRMCMFNSMWYHAKHVPMAAVDAAISNSWPGRLTPETSSRGHRDAGGRACARRRHRRGRAHQLRGRHEQQGTCPCYILSRLFSCGEENRVTIMRQIAYRAEAVIVGVRVCVTASE